MIRNQPIVNVQGVPEEIPIFFQNSLRNIKNGFMVELKDILEMTCSNFKLNRSSTSKLWVKVWLLYHFTIFIFLGRPVRIYTPILSSIVFWFKSILVMKILRHKRVQKSYISCSSCICWSSCESLAISSWMSSWVVLLPEPSPALLELEVSLRIWKKKIHHGDVFQEFFPWMHLEGRDLARTGPACLLDRQFPENLFLNKLKFQCRIYNFDFLGVISDNQMFS